MGMLFDDVAAGGQIFCGAGNPIALGIGESKIRGSCFIEGPQIVGGATKFPAVYGTLMVGPLSNSDTSPVSIPGSFCGANYSPYSLVVSGNAAIFDNLTVNSNIHSGNDIIAQGEVKSRCGGHILSAKKNFDIPHPTRDGWRLRHTCPEGPSNDVYFRGRITNKAEILLPTYWKDLVDYTTITVNLTPIGAHQDVIVKRIDDEKVYLQSKGGMPINCYYHIFGERKDGERLISEYPGESPEDYPGNNNEYSVSGYHYDRKK
ncbi:MAG: hypothetical protein EBS34_13260 [Flavobacteriales bacterium]|nr:hypothetical protein [Flavobacteriales bacterium]